MQIVPRKNSRLAARVVDGRAMLVVIDQQALHTLNEVGTHVWELCDGRNVGAIVDAVVQEFTVDEDTARRDVKTFLTELQELGAVELPDA